MDYITFIKYVKERNGYISIPEVQQFFNCSYREVKPLFDAAVTNNLIVCSNGMFYEIIDSLSSENVEKVQENQVETDNDEDIKNNIKKLFEQRKTLTIPWLQQEFNLEYSIVYKIISELLDENFISFYGGLEYIIMIKPKEKESKEKSIDEVIAERREYLRTVREKLIRRFKSFRDNNEDDEDDYFDEDNEDDDEEDNENVDTEESKPKFEDFFYSEDKPRKKRDESESGRYCYVFRNGKLQKLETNKEENHSNNADDNDYDLTKRRLLVEEYKRQQCEDPTKKEEYEQQLKKSRQSLLNAIYNISVAQDDDKRLLNGNKYSKEYIDAVGCGAMINCCLNNKFRITINNLMVAERFPFSVFLLYNGNKTCLSDDGRTLYFLEERLGRRRAREKLENHTRDKSWIYCENDKLFVPTDIKTARQDIFNMYYALRALLENF